MTQPKRPKFPHAQPNFRLTHLTCLHMHDARTCRTTEIPQSDRVVGTTRHERVIRGRHFQTDDSFRVALEIPQEFVVVQGKVSAIG